MKVKFKKIVINSQNTFSPGTVAELPDWEAQRLINLKAAEKIFVSEVKKEEILKPEKKIFTRKERR